MGYYDDLYQSEKKQTRSYGTGRLVLTSITSAVIGGLVVLLLAPTLSEKGWIPKLESPSVETNSHYQTSDEKPATRTAQAISVNVDSGIVNAVAKVENAIVGIINYRTTVDFWSQRSGEVEAGQGSGVIFEKKNGKAYIVTNHHVIEGAEKVEVALPNGDKESAKLVGADPLTDLAVLEIDGSKVNDVAEFGDSDAVRVGEPAIAIGNPLGLEFSRTVTQGIVSSTDRSMPIDVDENGETDWELDVMQTDAAINPGNSGGALVNIHGQVIGINTLKIARTGVEGLGFAIPINDVKKITAQIMDHGYVKRGYLGISPRDVSNYPSSVLQRELNLPESVKAGVIVMEVGEFTPAGKAGIQQYDVIVKLDDTDIKTGAQLRKYLTLEKSAGDKVKVTYYRNGFKKTTTVTLGEQSRSRQ
jgi:serine protease Do